MRVGIGVDVASFAVRFINAAVRHQPRPHWDFSGMRWVKPDMQVRTEVFLDPAGQETVAVGEDDIIEVWLGYAEQAETRLTVFRGDERIGVAPPEADDVYGPAVRAAREEGLIPLTMATRQRAADGSVRLTLGRPVPGYSHRKPW